MIFKLKDGSLRIEGGVSFHALGARTLLIATNCLWTKGKGVNESTVKKDPERLYKYAPIPHEQKDERGIRLSTEPCGLQT